MLAEPLAFQIARRLSVRPSQGTAFAAFAAIVLATGSCTRFASTDQPILAAQTSLVGTQGAPVQLASATPGEDPLALPPELRGLDLDAPPTLSGASAFQANAALPITAQLGPVAAPLTLAGSDAASHLRAQDCLAQTVYYEAGNQPEDGQRAVAQVVLNRVRHPLWPKSVCGVVYQGPMGNGGPRQCQFSFTCTGGPLPPPRGAAWAQAQRIAAEALGGRVFAPVGLSTFYHANYVMPAWAPHLVKTAVIGAHIFYRLPGVGSAAFSDRYAGVEPLARANAGFAGVTRAAGLQGPGIEWTGGTTYAAAARGLSATVDVPEPVAAAADLQVRPEYRQSGQWRDDAPAAITGR
jgi:Cell Wall Hydrolase